MNVLPNSCAGAPPGEGVHTFGPYGLGLCHLPPENGNPAFWHMMIGRRDGEPPGRERYPDFMAIKDRFIGPEHEAIELYPARSREIDAANVYHLWCLAERGGSFHIGWPMKALVRERPPAHAPDALSPWTAFEESEPPTVSEEQIASTMNLGMSRESAVLALRRNARDTFFRNSRYEVQIGEHFNPLSPIFVRLKAPLFRVTIRPLHLYPPGTERYTDFMRIKDELIGAEHEAVEVYPRRSAELDVENAYHLWTMQDELSRFPISF